MVLAIFSSCGSSTDRLKQELSNLQSKAIKLPLGEMECQIDGKASDSTILAKSDFKLIIYSHPATCSSCAIKGLHIWDDLIDYSNKHNGRLMFYFIYAPKLEKIKEIKISLRSSLLDYPMFIDTAQVFAKANPHIPKNPALHTFLLDENNNVILVGSPLNNPNHYPSYAIKVV